MEITHEILAAYADGTLSENLLPEVRKYLATHPEELDQVLLLMDTSHPVDDTQEQAILSPVCGKASIASSGAAFVVSKANHTSRPKPRKLNIQSKLTNLLDEIL